MRFVGSVVLWSAAVVIATMGQAQAGIILTSTGSFSLRNNSSAGLAVDGSTIFVSHTRRPELDRYSLSGTFLGTTPLTGVVSDLDGYTGAAIKDANHLYLTAMFDPNRSSAIYEFTKSGVFVDQVNIDPAVRNAISIAFDGVNTYVAQNDSPFFAYRVDPATGSTLQTYASNPGHGQRLGMAFWATGDVLFESYDRGVSVVDPATGAELQHLTSTELGNGKQIFAADVFEDTLYVMTLTDVYIYDIQQMAPTTATPEPSSLALFDLGSVVMGIGVVRRRRRKRQPSECLGS